MSPRTAAAVARCWTRAYTAGVRRDLRDARRAEIESDLWESVVDGAGSRHILARLALGIADDLTWSLTCMDTTTRSTAGWSFGSLVLFGMTWLWLANAPQSDLMRESRWAFPAALVLHVVGIVMFVGLRFAVDLRLTGLALTSLPAGDIIGRLAPWTLIGATVTAVSGLALYSGGFNTLGQNPAFAIKMGAMAAALVNVWFFHAVTCRSLPQWTHDGVPPRAARVSGYLSLALWVTMIAAGELTAFMGS
jgi:hypothetical protein